jgi:hypothetical protein
MAFVSPSAAKVIYVDANAHADFNNIQAAINDANNGDIVEIQPGTYRGIGNRDIDFLGKAITVRSADSNNPNIVASTVIDCNGTEDEPHRGFYFHNGEDTSSILDGLTITGGYANEEFFGGWRSFGGAVLCHGSNPTIRNCTIISNSADWGGGIYCRNESSPTINNCTIIGNSSSGYGGGIGAGGSPGSYFWGSSLTITNSAITGNSADYGGGIYCAFGHPTISNCTISDNTATLGGGIACNNQNVSTISNCTLSRNTGTFGGGIWCDEVSQPTISNCTLSLNQADNAGGGIFCDRYSNPKVINCILWDDSAIRGDEIALYSEMLPPSITVSYSNVEGGSAGVYIDIGCTLNWGEGNIDTDPCFVDLNNGDYHLKSQAGRWDPNSESWVMDYVSSPCIDSGNPGCPLSDEPNNSNNVRINMGAYGDTVEASKSPGNGRNIADLTNDWAVDSNDLKVFVNYWLETGECIPGDLNRNLFTDFNDYSIFASQWSYKQDSVAIFIDSNTHSNLTSQIQRLKSDIINDLGVNVFIFSDNWNDIREIKDTLIDKYNHEKLIGAIFIGQIPTAYFEYQNSGSNPTDRYFQDLSDNFIDVDGDGKFEREYYMWETDVMMREIWTARIKPPVGGAEGTELLRDYLDRNHNYRNGNLSYDKKMLYYGSISINQNGMSQDDYNDLVNQIDDYTGLYDSDDEVDSIYDTDLEMQKRKYLTALMNNYDFVFVNIHGTVWHQWLGELNPTDQCVVYYNEIKEFRPQPLYSVLASCSNGDFTTENYFAGWYLFSGNSLIVQANSTVSYLTGANTMEFLKDYIPLGLGVTFGDMDKNDRSFLVSHILGDPTLTLRPKPAGELPRLSRYASEMDFGNVERGTIPRQYISFWNGGTAPLTISYKKAPFSINGEYANLGYWDVFYYEPSTTGETFRDFEVRPGKCKVVPFSFYPRADGPTGRYTMTILFQTNDPENPYIKIHLSGNAI